MTTQGSGEADQGGVVGPMPAGRELDALVAELVMGWTEWTNCHEGDWDGPDDVTVFARWDGGIGVYLPEDNGDESFYFHPSEDMAAAWRVVERLREAGLHMTLDTMAHGYQATFAREGDTSMYEDIWHEVTDARAPTAPLAICLAALAATTEGSDPHAG